MEDGKYIYPVGKTRTGLITNVSVMVKLASQQQPLVVKAISVSYYLNDTVHTFTHQLQS